jgi:hypothetical protein
MAADKIVRVDVNSNLKEQTAQAKEFNKELNKAQKSATRTGSRAADAALGVSGGAGGGLGRGATGAGGRGSERDFARQAQGLGGLVHVYATFAANIYAVTAAFGALQRAADISNMLKSADALSARYGVSLRNVANELKNITGQAIDTESALQFSAMGASAGLTSKQMQDLTLAATGASKALGRDLNDSMQRVFKGAIKLEPELLDELGIMVRVDDAVQEYARSLNKSALSLTIFEKQQAFANAVIEQGNRKFADAAQISANPYTKLLASIKELQQDGLGLLNQVLGPIVNILAQSPTALIAAVGLLIAKLAKMAMPDLLPKAEQRFEAAAAAAEAAAARMKQANKDIGKAFEQTTAFKFISSADQTKLVKQAADLGKRLKDSLALDIETSSGKGPVKLSIDTEDLRKQYEAAIIKAQKNAQRIIADPRTSEKTRGEKSALLASLGAELRMVQALEGGLTKLANVEELAAKARIQENIATVSLMREQNALHVTQLQMKHQYVRAIIDAYKREQLVTKELRDQNKQMGGGALRGVGIGIAGSARAVGGALKAGATGLLAFMGPAAAVTATLAMLGGTIYSLGRAFNVFTDASEKVGKAFEGVDTNVKSLATSGEKLRTAANFNEVLDFKLGNLKLISETTSAIRELSLEYDNFVNKATGGDKVLEWFKELLPLIDSVGEKFSKGFGKTLETLVSQGKLDSNQVRQPLARLMFEQGGSTAQRRALSMPLEELVENALKTPEGRKELRKLEYELEQLGKESASVAANISQVKDSVKTLSTVTKDYVNKLIPQTELTKAQSAVIQGYLGTLADSDAAVEFLKSFTTELSSFTNLPIPKNLQEAREGLENVELAIAALEKAGDLKPEEISKWGTIARKAVLEQNNVYKSLTAFTIDLTGSTKEMALAAINSEAAIAKLNRQLRLINVGEGLVGGQTRASEAARIQREEAIASKESEALRTQQSQIAQLLSSRASMVSRSLEVSGISGVSAEELRGVSGLQTLASKVRDEADPAKIKELLAAYDALTQLQLANLAVQGKLDAAQAKRLSTLEKVVRLDKAAASEAKMGLDAQNKTLDERVKLLTETQQLYGSISPVLANMNQAEITSAQTSKEINTLLQERQTVEKELQRLREFKPVDWKAGELLKEQELQINRAAEARLKLVERLSLANLEIQASELQSSLITEKVNAGISLQQALVSDINSSYKDQASTAQTILTLQNDLVAVETKLSAQKIKQYEKLQNVARAQGNITAETNLQLQIDTERLKIAGALAQSAKQEAEAKRNIMLLGMAQAERTGEGLFSKEYASNFAENLRYRIEEADKQVGSLGDTFATNMLSAVEDVSSKITEMFIKGEFSAKNMANAVRSMFSQVIADLAAQYLKSALVNLIGQGIGMVAGAFAPAAGAASFASAAPSISSVPAGLGSGTYGIPFAKGGVMTDYGPLKLEKYARGGIATSPQLALYGEGRQNEAYVPLPDNRTIPVTLKGSTGSQVVMGDTNISVTVNSDGSSDTDVKGGAEFGKNLAVQIKGIVHKEMMDQMRPGGILVR